MKKVLDIKNLYFAYKNEYVLKNINLEVYQRDFLAIIGPNGGGKSTLLKLILGLLKPTKGKIELFEKKVGYVPQNTDININFPIKTWEVVSLGFKPNKKLKIKVEKLLKEVGLEGYFDKKLDELSGGQRQRVFIARALFLEPKLLLLDEPTSSLDPSSTKNIYELLKELNKNITIIVISHNIFVTVKYASKIAYINKTIYMHNSPKFDLKNKDKEHFCEIELMDLLGESFE